MIHKCSGGGDFKMDTSSNALFSGGNVGIGTTGPNATLDMNGYEKLKKNSSAPVTCAATYDGSLAMMSARHLCVCDGSNWTDLVSGSACS